MKHTLSYFILVLFASLWTSCSPSASEPQSATSLNQLPDIPGLCRCNHSFPNSTVTVHAPSGTGEGNRQYLLW